MMEYHIPITIQLNQEELIALRILARRQRRDPEEQAAMMIHRMLEEYGLIPWRPDSHMPIDDLPIESDGTQLLSQR